MDQPIPRQRHAEALVILAAVVLMAYANSFASGFVVDGRPLILENARVHTVTRVHVKEILSHGYSWPAFDGGLYRPIATLSYLLNFAVLGNYDQPDGYHWFNCLLHVGNAFLVYLLALLLVRQYWPALSVAILWALHPICTEAVTNIAGRPEELAAFGVLAALLLYIHGGPESGWRKLWWRIGMMGAATVAVFSKESGVMVLALAVLYDFTWRARRSVSWRDRAAAYVYLALPVLFMLSVRWLVLRRDGAMETGFVDNPLIDAGFLTGRATALGVIGKYVGLLAWPRTLSCDYSYNQIPLLQWHSMTCQQVSALLAVAGLLLAAALCYRKSRTGFFLLGFSALTLLPAANLLVITGTIMAERLLYLPAVGFAAAVAIGIHRLVARLGLRPMVAALLVGSLGVAYGARTYTRNTDWKDGETIYLSAQEAAPNSVRPHLSLADSSYALDPGFQQGDRAIVQAERAVAIVGSLPDRDIPAAVLALLGRIYCARGDVAAGPASVEWYRKALAVDLRAVPVDRAFNENHRLRELAHGRSAYEIGIAGLPSVYENLGDVYLRLGDPQEALQSYLYARRLGPRLPQAYTDIASVELALHETEKAATAMLEGYALDDSQATLSKVEDLYAKIESGDCAIGRNGLERSLNRDCPVVQRDLCSAYGELEQVFREAKQQNVAELFREAARHVAGCQ